MRTRPQIVAILALLVVVAGCRRPADVLYPGEPRPWPRLSPAEAGLDEGALDRLARLVRGHGCVVRDGKLVYTWGDPSRSVDIASACKPVISALLMFALQDGLRFF